MKYSQAYKNVIGLMAISLFLYMGCDQKASEQKASIAVSPTVSDSEFLANAGSLAMNDPDKFNWTIFSRICKPAASQEGGSGKPATNDVVWETWADDVRTYPQSPDPANPPEWPGYGIAPQRKTLEPITQQSFRAHLLQKLGQVVPLIAPNGGSEEVRRNKTSFDFIIKNGLWYQQGLASEFKIRTSNTYEPLSFPTGAVEVKAIWRKIPKDSMAFFHWNYDAAGDLYGLIALHIMTKALPNWTWATWEWVGNTGRCDDLGCHDSFGVVPANVSPNGSEDKGYAPGRLTASLVQLFKDQGVADEWKNYRLKGSQVDWTDATGRTTLLGNSITESGFVQTSSCITCHSVASFNAKGVFQNTIGFTPSGQSQNGPVNPSNFWTLGAPPFGKLVYLQYDFVWGVLRAKASTK